MKAVEVVNSSTTFFPLILYSTTVVFPVWRIILPFSIRRKIDQGPVELIPALLIWGEEMSILAKAFSLFDGQVKVTGFTGPWLYT